MDQYSLSNPFKSALTGRLIRYQHVLCWYFYVQRSLKNFAGGINLQSLTNIINIFILIKLNID